MAIPRDRYIQGMWTKFGYHATWLPNAPIEIGNVGRITDGVFERWNSLGDLGVKFNVGSDGPPVDFSHTSESGVSIELNTEVAGPVGHILGGLPVAGRGGAVVRFDGEGAFLFQAARCVQTEISDADAVARQILRSFARKRWESDWAVVSKIQRAECATILISNSKSARVDLSAKAKLGAGGLALADAAAGLKWTGQSGDVTQFVVAERFTPLYRVLRVKQSWLNKLFGVGSPGVVYGAVPDPEMQRTIDEIEARDVLEEVPPLLRDAVQ